MTKLVDIILGGAILAAAAVGTNIALHRRAAEDAVKPLESRYKTQTDIENARQKGLAERFENGDASDIVYIGSESNKNFVSVKTELPVFPQFQHVDYRIHDGKIKTAVDKWNDYFTQRVKDFEPLDAILVKAICLTESGSPKDRASWLNDPMSLAHEGDIGFEDVIKKDDAHYIPGNTALAKLERTPFSHGQWNYEVVPRSPGKMKIYAGLSIDEGVHLLCQKGLKFEMKDGTLEASFRGWKEAVSRYNGGGDKQYVKKVEEKMKSIKVDLK